MRSLRRIAARRPVSVLCIVAMMIPSLVGVLLPSPAVAQVQTTRVAVVDFKNQSKVPGEMFSTMSRDAVVVELVKAGKFDVTPTESLQSTMEKLGYSEKGEHASKIVMSESMMQQLGKELGVSSVVDGTIISMEINRQKKYATVKMAVRMLDVASGELINGAIATGVSHQRIGFTGDQDTDWVVEAVTEAAHKCVDTMVKYIIPEAYILHTIDADTVLLNKGTQDGVQPGMNMVVFRTGEDGADELVARVKILSVSDTDANATVVWSSRGVKPQDRARAIYDVPTYTTGSDTEGPRNDRSDKQIKSAKSWLMGALALGGLWWLFGRGGQKAETTPDVFAALVGTPDMGMADTGIVIAWDTPSSLASGNILEYHVWRDVVGVYGNTSTSSSSSSSSTTTTTGTKATTGTTTTTTGNTGLCQVVMNNVTVPWSSILGSFDHFAIDDTNPSAGTYQCPVIDTASSNPVLGTGTFALTGLDLGTTHTYYVSTVYQRSTSDNSGTAIQVYGETNGTGACVATLLSRPIVVSPGNASGSTTVDLSKVAFQWQGVKGGNQYVIEVSPTPEFVRSQTWVSSIINQAVNITGTTVRWPSSGTSDISSATELKNLAEGQQLWWRVGARNSADRPGPVPAGPSAANGGAKSTRFIYTSSSMIYSFLNAGTPVTPPVTPASVSVTRKK